MNTEVRSTSPHGKYIVTVAPWEARMSLWIESPAIAEIENGKELLSFRDSNWSLDSAKWLDNATVVLKLRKYPGNHTPAAIEATVDCANKTAMVNSAQVYALNELEQQLEQSLTWSHERDAESTLTNAGGWRKWLSGFFGK